MILVTGITGRVGAAVARHLLESGHRVRALVRDPVRAAGWAARGIELAEGDLGDPVSVVRALDGVAGAYFMLPPVYAPSRDFRESTLLIEACAQALAQVPPPRLVVLSANGAEKSDGLGAITPLSLLEKALLDLPCPRAFIRAGSFYENFLFGLQAARAGVLPLFYSRLDDPHPMTAIEDIGLEAARLLVGPGWSGRRVIELGSMVSPRQMATQLGEVLERPVRAESVPREQWAAALHAGGIAEGQTWAIEAIYDGVNSHWIGFGVEGTERAEGATSAREVFAAAHEAAQRTNAGTADQG